MARYGSAALFAVASLAATGCAGTDHQSGYAVGADDQSEALVIVSRWTEGHSYYMGIRSYGGNTFEVRTYSLESGRLRTLVGETSGSAYQAWYMRAAGYALLAYEEGECCAANRPHALERVSLDGSRRTLWRGLAPAIWLPSPDGALLARLERTPDGCPPPSPTSVCTNTLTFLSAETYEPLGPPVAVWVAATHPSYAMWTPSGEFYVYVESRAFDAGYSSVLVTPGSAPRPVEPLPCTQETPRPSVLPATSSDYVSHDGRMLRAAVDEDDSVTLTIEDTGMPGWPTRCFPSATP